MATLALGLAGSAIGSSLAGGSTAAVALGLSAAQIGGLIGASVGGIIDQAFIFPLLTPGTDISGPQLTDLQLQTSAEGQNVKYVLGPRNRVAGNLLWMLRNEDGTRIRTTKSTSKQGGKGGGGGSSSTTYSYSTDVAVGVCEGPVTRIRRIWADSDLIYDNGVLDDRYDNIWVYTGTATQTPNSLIEAQEGAGLVPGYRGLAYVVIQNLQLADWGNRLPQFTFEVSESEEKTIAQALDDLLERAGLVPAQYDTSRVVGCFQGLIVDGPTRMNAAIEPILQAYDIMTQEINGVLRFFHLGDEESVTVVEGDLAAGQGSAEDDRPVTFNDISALDRANEVVVRYLDYTRDLQQGGVSAKLLTRTSQMVDTLSLPVTLDADEAKRIAFRRLRRLQAERLQISGSLPMRYVGLLPNDVIRVTIEGEEYTVRVDRTDLGANGVLRFVGSVFQTATIADVNLTTQSTALTGKRTYVAPDLTLALMDLPALRSEDLVDAGFYWAVAVTDSEALWRGGTLLESLDDTTFSSVESALGETSMGTASTTLADGPLNQWDLVNTLDVVMFEGSLESAPNDNAVLNGENTMLVGEEIIAFRFATLTAPNTYRLSKLLRGVRDTGAKTTGHVASETCVLLSDGTIGRRTLGTSALDQTRYYKGVSVGRDESAVSSSTLVPAGETLKPASPAVVAGSRNGSNDLTVTLTRRSRALASIIGRSAAPLLPDESPEAYELDVLTAPGGTVLRTLESSDGTFSYTAAQQTTDGLTPGATVHVDAYQMSTIVGRGRPRAASV